MSQPHSEVARIVGERISALRNGLGISQQELGELAGIHFTNIGKIERGLANPTLLTLVRIAAALEIDPGTLIQGLTGDMVPDRPHTVTVSDLIAARK
ncbi:MAG: helix-turn-helix domain-containing protein [Pseudoclavibacter sp.]